MAQRRVLVIVNPAAGRRRHGHFAAVRRELDARGCAVTVRETTGPGAAETLARNALDEAFDVIVAAGGDGTINEVINGVAGAAQPVGVLPLGTANVMALEIGLGRSAGEVARTIAGGAARPVYFARAGGRVFTLMAGAGMDARVVAGVDLRLKRRLGKLAYAWQTLKEVARGPRALYEVTIDDEVYHAAAVIVANGHFYGGRFICAPEARLEEPLLHVCLMERPGRLNAARYALALVAGRLGRMKDYRIVTARALKIDGPRGEPLQMDGDVGVRLPAAVEVIEEPFLLVMP